MPCNFELQAVAELQPVGTEQSYVERAREGDVCPSVSHGHGPYIRLKSGSLRGNTEIIKGL